MRGKQNQITDVPGVFVGQQTIHVGSIHTGVTAILPNTGNLFRQKLPAAVHVINGFGKSAGTIQVAELGTLETPILLTNTFGVGTCSNALIRHMLATNPEIGDTTSTVNPLVFECNDGDINDIRALAVTEKDAQMALNQAKESFTEGAVGAGTSMVCHDLKGGIGSASQILTFDHVDYTIGALVLTNYGQIEDLTVYGHKIGPEIQQFYQEKVERQAEKGSVIVIVATDLPLDSRQLTRVSKRASVGITRTGAFIGHGSGEIVLSFSTAQTVAHFSKAAVTTVQVFNENLLDKVFKACAEVVEEAVLSSLVQATATTNRWGKPVRNLLDCLNELQAANFSNERAHVIQQLTALKK
jgi:D-aminopeptidase